MVQAFQRADSAVGTAPLTTLCAGSLVVLRVCVLRNSSKCIKSSRFAKSQLACWQKPGPHLPRTRWSWETQPGQVSSRLSTPASTPWTGSPASAIRGEPRLLARAWILFFCTILLNFLLIHELPRLTEVIQDNCTCFT